VFRQKHVYKARHGDFLPEAMLQVRSDVYVHSMSIHAYGHMFQVWCEYGDGQTIPGYGYGKAGGMVSTPTPPPPILTVNYMTIYMTIAYTMTMYLYIV
jgi:hypothetical protein